MTGYVNVLTLALQAADTNGIAHSQTPGGAGNLTLNGDLVTGGVASLVTAQYVIITSAGNDSGRTFTITGTDRYGRAQTEALVGANTGVATSAKNFLTVSGISVDAGTAGAITAGINAVGSTSPLIVDRFVNPASYSFALVMTGTVNSSLEVSYDDLAPNWDLTSNSPTWFAPSSAANKTSNTAGTISGPVTMLRLANNSGTGTTTATIVTPLAGSS